MKTAIKSFKIIKKMYKYFVEKYRDLEPKLMTCEKEDFDNVEKALKALEFLKNQLDIKFETIENRCFITLEFDRFYARQELPKQEFDLLKEVLK